MSFTVYVVIPQGCIGIHCRVVHTGQRRTELVEPICRLSIAGIIGPCPACKTVYAGSIPAVASTSFPRLIRPKAGRSGILPGRWRVTDGSSRRGPTGQFMLPCDIDFAAMRETTVFMLVYQSYMEMEQEQACPGDQK